MGFSRRILFPQVFPDRVRELADSIFTVLTLCQKKRSSVPWEGFWEHPAWFLAQLERIGNGLAVQGILRFARKIVNRSVL
jgi:hypothetical protein